HALRTWAVRIRDARSNGAPGAWSSCPSRAVPGWVTTAPRTRVVRNPGCDAESRRVAVALGLRGQRAGVEERAVHQRRWTGRYEARRPLTREGHLPIILTVAGAFERLASYLFVPVGAGTPGCRTTCAPT